MISDRLASFRFVEVFRYPRVSGLYFPKSAPVWTSDVISS